MFQNRVHQQLNKTFSIPGKVFILGEYAVLAGLPALVAAVGPRFQMTVSPSEPAVWSSPISLHSGSPLARIRIWAHNLGLPNLEFQFQDPFQGAGGFGASTAQFAMAYLAHCLCRGDLDRRWTPVWKLYRDLMGGELLIPSGADLVAQWQGGISFFEPKKEFCQDLGSMLNWASLLVFSATVQKGRKVPTHEHLRSLAQMGFPAESTELISALEKPLFTGLEAIYQMQIESLGIAMNQYAQVLQERGLEVPLTTKDRGVLGELPGVLGVKGTGAMQSDALLVLMDSSVSDRFKREKVIEVAYSRGLRLVSDGLTCQMGVQCQI